MLVILVLGITTMFVNSLSNSAMQNARDRVTAESLAQAKEALIGYALKVQVSNSNGCVPNCPRPGDLPCPDTNNDGLQESSCGNASGSTGQSSRIGRLPWKTLGLPDLRDGSGERLWYAVSNNFKYSTRTATLNSDTPGTISVFAPDGTQLNNGASTTGAVAIVIAPSTAITRQDNILQDRSCTVGTNCTTAEVCTTTPHTATPKCNPINYLDVATLNGIQHDNASFIDSSVTDGFIQGRVNSYDPATRTDNILINDQILPLTSESIMLGIQKRVAAEVKNCLVDYALNNNDRYPWAAPTSESGSNYNDNAAVYFGRIPDTMNDTKSDSWNGSSYQMSYQWESNCNTHNNNTPSGWWLSWKELVFYGVARSFRPNDTPPSSFPSVCTTAGRCLNINNATTPAKFVVLVAGKKLSTPNQTNRSANKADRFYYLEGGNESVSINPPSDTSNTFVLSAPTDSFNDTLIYQ
jgi:hypothetical protein